MSASKLEIWEWGIAAFAKSLSQNGALTETVFKLNPLRDLGNTPLRLGIPGHSADDEDGGWDEIGEAGRKDDELNGR